MRGRAWWVAALLVGACTPPFQFKPRPPDSALGVKVSEGSPLRASTAWLEHHGTSLSLLIAEERGWDTDFEMKPAAWRMSRIELPGFATQPLPPPPIEVAGFRMAIPIGDADVDAVLGLKANANELAVREGSTWKLVSAPGEAVPFAFMHFMAIAGPDQLALESEGAGVWVLRANQWVQLAPDLGGRVSLVAWEGDRMRLVAGGPLDLQTGLPTGVTTIALISFSTGERLAPDLVAGDRFRGLVQTSLNGTVDDFQLIIDEQVNSVLRVPRVTRYLNGALHRRDTRAPPLRFGETPLPLATPGGDFMVLGNTRSLAGMLRDPQCGCDVRYDPSCGCVFHNVVARAVLVEPAGRTGIGLRRTTEEARVGTWLQQVDLATFLNDVAPQPDPGACSPACAAPSQCFLKEFGAHACEVGPDAGTTALPVLTSVLKAQLDVPPGFDAGAIDVTVSASFLNLPAPGFDVVDYGPALRLSIEADVAGRLVLELPGTSLNTFVDYPAVPAGGELDLGTLRFSAPVQFQTFGSLPQLTDVEVHPRGRVLATSEGRLSYLAFDGQTHRFRDTGINAPFTIRDVNWSGLALVTSSQGTFFVPNGLADGGAAGPIDPPAPLGPIDPSSLVVASDGPSWVVSRLVNPSPGQQPATCALPTGMTFQIAAAGEADAFNAEGSTLVRREGAELVRYAMTNGQRAVMETALFTGPAALLPANLVSGLTPSVVIVEGAAPAGCLRKAMALCSVRLRRDSLAGTSVVSTAAQLIAVSRDGRFLFMDEGAGPVRFDLQTQTRAAIALPPGFVTVDLEQMQDVLELFAADGRIVAYDLANGTVLQVLSARSRVRRLGGIVVQADGCGSGEPCAVRSYTPDRDELVDYGPGSAKRTLFNDAVFTSVGLSGDSLLRFTGAQGTQTEVIVPMGFHTVLVPPFDDGLMSFGAPCALFTLDAQFNGTSRVMACQ